MAAEMVLGCSTAGSVTRRMRCRLKTWEILNPKLKEVKSMMVNRTLITPDSLMTLGRESSVIQSFLIPIKLLIYGSEELLKVFPYGPVFTYTTRTH